MDIHLLCLVKNTRSSNADLGTFNLLHEKLPLLLEIDNLELEGVLFEGTSVKESNQSILVQFSMKI